MTANRDQVIRLSLRWVIFGILLLFIFGVLGGVAGTYLFGPPQPPLTATGDRVVTTVQEVTISPNKAAADLVAGANRSVFLLGQVREGSEPVIIGTAVAITNDGLLATIGQLEGALTAFDETGRSLPVQRVGIDPVFGITYFRLPSSVVIPLDVRQDDVAVGHTLLALGRSDISYGPHTESFMVREYEVPAGEQPAGWQRLLRGDVLTGEFLRGAPLLDDEGRIAGLVIDGRAGQALAVNQLQESFSRIANNRREDNPLTDLGLAIRYTFVRPAVDQAVQFGAHVVAVTPGSPAAQSRLQRGDVLLKIGEDEVQWHRSVISQLSQGLPMQLTVLRGEEQVVLTVSPTVLPSP